MKIITAVAVAQLFLLVAGGDEAEASKKLGCLYFGREVGPNITLYPEDVDASLCSHLEFIQGKFWNETDEIILKTDNSTSKMGDGDVVTRLVKLKAVNPDLKLTLLIHPPDMESISEPSRRTKIIQNAVKWLNETGFDGLGITIFIAPEFRDKMADFICEIKSEFDKYGYMLTALLADRFYSDPISGKEDTISKLARCCEYVSLVNVTDTLATNYLAPMKDITSDVDWFLKRGLPANKMKIVVPIFGLYVRVEDPKETGLGSKISVSDPDRNEKMGNFISYKELQKKFKDSTQGWTIHREETTKEVYAFNQKGLWTTYEDPESLAYKARYVLEKGLRGMVIAPIDVDDYEGDGEEGRFPLTRAIYNTFRQQNITIDTTP